MDGAKRWLLLLLAVIAVIGPALLYPHSATAHDRRQVLLLHSYHPGYRWTDAVSAGVYSRLVNVSEVELLVEHMDAKRFTSAAYLDGLQRLYAIKFGADNESGHRLEAVICSDDQALDFALAHRQVLFPDIPVIFCGINDFKPARIVGHNAVTGVVENYDFAGTIGEILRLHPEATSVVVVGDNSKSGRAGMTRMRRAASTFSHQVNFEYLIGLGRSDLEHRLSRLEPSSLVLHVTYVKPDLGPVLTFDQGRRLVARASPVPVYSPWDYVPGQGLVGGRSLTGESQGAAAAELAIRVLEGESAGDIPVVTLDPNPYMFDYPVLERFGLDEDQLPVGAVLVGKPQSAWAQHGNWIIGIVVFTLFQTALIVFLIVLRLQRKRLAERLVQAHKMEAIGRLAGGVAHDFRNQLTVIGGYCDMLSDSLPHKAPEHDWLQQIRRSTDRATTMVRQLLAFGREESLQPRLLDLNRRLKSLLEPLGRLIGEDVSLGLTLTKEDVTVEVDQTRFEQAIMNLASNARDAMPDGGRLTFETTLVVLGPNDLPGNATSPPGPYACVRCIDTGAGMDPGTITRIFDPFFTTKSVGEGTGLGLSMVHGFIHQSGGFVRVMSEPEQGTTFTLFFPHSDGEAENTAELPEEVTREEGSGQVLVVEDDEAVLELVEESLLSLGYQVVSTTASSRAIGLVEEDPRRFDILITDVVMPEMYGPDLARRVLDVQPDISVLFMSGYSKGNVHAHGPLPAGARLLEKPFSRETLGEAVAHALNERPDGSPATLPNQSKI